MARLCFGRRAPRPRTTALATSFQRRFTRSRRLTVAHADASGPVKTNVARLHFATQATSTRQAGQCCFLCDWMTRHLYL